MSPLLQSVCHQQCLSSGASDGLLLDHLSSVGVACAGTTALVSCVPCTCIYSSTYVQLTRVYWVECLELQNVSCVLIVTVGRQHFSCTLRR